MQKRVHHAIRRVLTFSFFAFTLSICGSASDEVAACVDGKARLPILTGSIAEPAQELQRYLERMTGASFSARAPASGDIGLYVGLARDFPWLKIEEADNLGPEGFIIKSDGRSILLVANGPLGVSHAVNTFLQDLGCRWFFPGNVWEVIPKRRTIAGSWNTRQTPSFQDQRRIWYGFGAFPQNKKDKDEWDRHNRMNGPLEIHIGHSWHGLNPKKDFAEHPDWFALVEGKRQPGKPCYSHPDVIRQATEHALAQAAAGNRVVSMSPPDGLGYCECERCRSVFRGGEPFREHSTLFAKRPDGTVVNITSETFFRMVCEVARAVEAKHPGTTVGTYAYSAYSHPPSFDFPPNVFVQTTTAFRRTMLSGEEQLAVFGRKARRLGVRDYYSVYQWDWDYPAVAKGSLLLPKLVDDLRTYRQSGVTAINAEASNNWGPRGLGYYVAAHLLWNVEADPSALIRDFYDKAFGPAAGAMEQYYVRWLGRAAAVSAGAGSGLKKALPRQEERKVRDELGSDELADATVFNRESIAASWRDLDEAAKRVENIPGCRERVDHLRMYIHYLVLRLRLEETVASGDRDRIVEAIRNETVFGARIMNTNMIHTRPLIGKAFPRRFRKYMKHLEGLPEADETTGRNAGFRKPRQDVPTREELQTLWTEDSRFLGLQ